MVLADAKSAAEYWSTFGFAIVGILAVLLVGGLLFLPYVIARRRKHKYAEWIGVVNLLTFYTGIGWLVALVWALQGPYQAAAVACPVCGAKVTPHAEVQSTRCPNCAELLALRKGAPGRLAMPGSLAGHRLPAQ